MESSIDKYGLDQYISYRVGSAAFMRCVGLYARLALFFLFERQYLTCTCSMSMIPDRRPVKLNNFNKTHTKARRHKGIK